MSLLWKVGHVCDDTMKSKYSLWRIIFSAWILIVKLFGVLLKALFWIPLIYKLPTYKSKATII